MKLTLPSFLSLVLRFLLSSHRYSLLNQRPLLVHLKVVLYSPSFLIDGVSQSLNLEGGISMTLTMRFYRSENKRFFPFISPTYF